MASKNSIKQYSEESYYHIYNRGVEKRPIFLDEQDYAVYLSYLKDYLIPKNEQELMNALSNPVITAKEKDRILKRLKMNNFHGEIFLYAYCLMSNHFHLLVKQKSGNSIDKFMNSIGVRYTMYFNKKYGRVGSLYQDVYKAVMVESDHQLLYLTSYIHRNPLINPPKSKLASQEDVLEALFSQPSSLPEYLGQRETEWVCPGEILGFFSRTNPGLSYQAFIQQSDDPASIQKIVIDI